MKKIEIEKLEKITGGGIDWCPWASAFFPPIAIGCLMRDIDHMLS